MYVSFYNSLQPFIKQWVRKMFLLSQGLIVLSESWKEFYQSIICDGSIPIWILPNAVELPAEPIAWDTTHDLRLLFLGLMTERKGSDRVLKAVARLPQPTRLKVSVFMAGNGMVEAMQSLATGLGISDRVTIRDWIQAEEKEAWLRDTNAFILPSQNEGLPNAMLEAMAWGKALIVSPVGGIPEFVTDGVEGFLVPPDAIDAIADAIRKLAENPDLRVQMGMAARKRVEPLDIQNYRIRLGEIYREALG
jgi:glycosyltransferase involved in cell wall biosynthesis